MIPFGAVLCEMHTEFLGSLRTSRGGCSLLFYHPYYFELEDVVVEYKLGAVKT